MRARDVGERFWSKVEKTDACWVWRGRLQEHGYGKFDAPTDRPWRTQTPVLSHRFSWEMAHGPIPEGLCVLHRCDNPPCVRPDHLFVGTMGDNTADMIAKGRHSHGPKAGEKIKRVVPRGEKHCRARLTEESVREIRSRRAAGAKWAELARDYSVSIGTVRAAVSRRNWSHVP